MGDGYQTFPPSTPGQHAWFCWATELAPGRLSSSLTHQCFLLRTALLIPRNPIARVVSKATMQHAASATIQPGYCLLRSQKSFWCCIAA